MQHTAAHGEQMVHEFPVKVKKKRKTQAKQPTGWNWIYSGNTGNSAWKREHVYVLFYLDSQLQVNMLKLS